MDREEQTEEWVPTKEQMQKIEQASREVKAGAGFSLEEAKLEIKRRVLAIEKIQNQDSA